MNPKQAMSRVTRYQLCLRAFVLSLALIIASCSGVSSQDSGESLPELPYTFGGNGFITDDTCARAKQYETASSVGCLEGYEISPSQVRVFVMANPPSSYYVTVLGCSSAENCPEVVLKVENEESPAPDAPAGTMARFSFLLSRPVNSSVNRICARQDTLLPNLPDDQSALLGCMTFSERNLGPAGAFRVYTDKEGVVVDGWILNPTTDGPVQLEVRRSSDSVAITADRPDTRSQARWPLYSMNHGFRAVLPFVGKGGNQSVCLGVPGWSTPLGSGEVSCAPYIETATFYLENKTYTVGDKIAYTAEMLDPGARIRLNLFTEGNFFLIPWKDIDLATVVADSRGHAEGEISTDRIPPGTYRLAFLCESGCSEMDEVPGETYQLDDGKLYSVALGPPFTIVSGTAASVSASGPKGGAVLVEGRDLPPSTVVEVYLLYGRAYLDGLRVEESVQATVGSDGRFSVTLPAPGLPDGTHMVYVVEKNDHVLASTVFAPFP